MKNRVALGSRLSACACLCRENSRTADIGTDHALLPVYLIQTGRSPHVFASDINPEPLARAAANIARYSAAVPDISERITLVLGSGLDNIPPSEVDDIVIAGIGGELIAGILAAAPWTACGRYRLILQPMSKHDRLRVWLYEHGFDIQSEIPVIDCGRCYSVMRCAYTGESRSPGLTEAYCGRIPDAVKDAGLRDAALRYLEMTKNRLADMKKGADISGSGALSSELGQSIEYITKIITS